MTKRLNNINVFEEQVLSTPVELKEELPLSDLGRENVLDYRHQLGEIMEGKDKRLLKG